MAKAPAKVGVECPHCGFKQLEYVAAKSTLCRQCGRHFQVGLHPAVTALRAAPEEPVTEPSLLRRLSGIWKQPRITSVACFDCGATQELTSAATSTLCPSCSAHLDLRDYKISTSFSRNIRTHGEVHITATGDLNSNNVVCRSAIIEGRFRGSLHCTERAEIRSSCKVHAKITGAHLVIAKKVEVQFFRQLHIGSLEIRGTMLGEVVAQTLVTITRTGVLEGNVVARSINVEKGGRFSGQLMIGQQTLQQAELLPAPEPADAPSPDKVRLRRRRPIVLPAT